MLYIRTAQLGWVLPKRAKQRKEDRPRFDPDYVVAIDHALRQYAEQKLIFKSISSTNI